MGAGYDAARGTHSPRTPTETLPVIHQIRRTSTRPQTIETPQGFAQHGTRSAIYRLYVPSAKFRTRGWVQEAGEAANRGFLAVLVIERVGISGQVCQMRLRLAAPVILDAGLCYVPAGNRSAYDRKHAWRQFGVSRALWASGARLFRRSLFVVIGHGAGGGRFIPPRARGVNRCQSGLACGYRFLGLMVWC